MRPGRIGGKTGQVRVVVHEAGLHELMENLTSECLPRVRRVASPEVGADPSHYAPGNAEALGTS